MMINECPGDDSLTKTIGLAIQDIVIHCNVNVKIHRLVARVQGHTCSLVRRTFVVRSVKDFSLVSLAVWIKIWSDEPSKPPQTSMN